MKYKIYYQKNDKLHSTISNSLNFKNIIKYKIIKEKEFKITQKEIFLFLFEIKNLLHSKISYIKALNYLIKLNSTKKIANFLLKNYNQNLPNNNLLFIFINFSKKSGNFNKNLNLLYEYIEKKELVKKELFSSVKYPLFLLSLLIFSFFAISNFIMPNFISFYNQNNIDLPTITKIMLEFNNFLKNYFKEVITGIVLFLLFIYLILKEQKDLVDKFLFKIKIVRFFLFYRFFNLLNIMVKSGETFQESLKKIIEIEKNRFFKKNLSKISKSIDSGVNFSKIIKRSFFDEIVKEMLIVGYNSNNLVKVFDDIALFYENNIKKEIKFIKVYLEPILVFIVFIFIFLLVISVMKPIWNLANLI